MHSQYSISYFAILRKEGRKEIKKTKIDQLQKWSVQGLQTRDFFLHDQYTRIEKLDTFIYFTSKIDVIGTDLSFWKYSLH